MIQEQLNDLTLQLERVITLYRRELESIPEGELRCSKPDGYVRFYKMIVENGVRKRVGIGKEPELVRALARKEFLVRMLDDLEFNLELLQKTRARYRPCLPQQVKARLSVSFQRIPEDHFYEPVGEPLEDIADSSLADKLYAHRKWADQPYEPSRFREEEKTVITSRGERMRSKAEAMIAEKLYDYGIPFRYEQELNLGEVVYHPDFTFEGADGEEFYLEFCGMMDDPAYVAAHQRKQMRYAHAGIVPWRNIIYVYSSANYMNMMQIDAVIKHQIVPWL